MSKIVLVFLAGILFTVYSCTKKDQKDLASAEKDHINYYLETNPTIHFQQKESGLYYLEVTAGTGNQPSIHDTAYVTYTGKFLDGYIFDSNADQETYSFPVGEGFNVPGFDEAVAYMKEGGKSLCLIPSSIGYGAYGWPPIIPGYEPLLFELSLVKVRKANPVK